MDERDPLFLVVDDLALEYLTIEHDEVNELDLFGYPFERRLRV